MKDIAFWKRALRWCVAVKAPDMVVEFVVGRLRKATIAETLRRMVIEDAAEMQRREAYRRNEQDVRWN